MACKAEFPLCILWKANEFGKSVSSWPLGISDESNESRVELIFILSIPVLFVTSFELFNECLNGCAVLILSTVSTAVLLNIVCNTFAVETSIVACKAEFPLCFHWKAKEFGKSVSSWP